eukprot:TRINITY_DN23216_c0_g1_i1.p1 TRINITY_DN23216_c0_g1~~TRINITY_DN23216_c0_g1_i1.p1  ORF type:complete len:103 (-),score=8.15 TRINITY_DN23216_c0_g1_i1:31-339(-)
MPDKTADFYISHRTIAGLDVIGFNQCQSKCERRSMRLLIVSDIFGLTSAFEAFAALFAPAHEVLCFSPYTDLPPDFSNDTDAYEYFSANGGHEQYQKRLLDF